MPQIIPGRVAATAPSTQQSQASQDAKARAIAKLSGAAPNQSQSSPVQNANKISPEEMGALQQGKGLAEAVKEKKKVEGQTTDITEEVKEEEQPVQEAATEEVDGQSDKVESPAETPEETEEKAKVDPLSSQYAVLARKEKALRAKVQAQDAAFQTREAAIKAKEQALADKENQYKSGYISKEEFQKNPWKIMADNGVTYDQLTEKALAQEKTDPAVLAVIDQLKEEVKAEREARLKLEKDSKEGLQEQQTKAYQQAVNQLKADAKALVESEPETYEALHAAEASDDVVELIEATFKEEGRLMSVEEAAQLVEEHLAEEAVKFARLKKVQKRLTPAPSPTKAAQQAEVKTEKQSQNKTITNTMGSNRPLTAKERALLAFKGELK